MQVSVIEEIVSPEPDKKVVRPLLGSIPCLPCVRGLETVIDFCIALVSLAGAVSLPGILNHGLQQAYSARQILAAAAMFALVIVLFLERGGAYRVCGGLLRVRETASIFEAGTFTALAVLIYCVIVGKMAWVVVSLEAVAISIPLLIVEKSVLHRIIARLRHTNARRKRVLIYGSAASAKRLQATLLRSPKLGLHPVAVVNDTQNRQGMPVDGDSTCTGIFDRSPAATLHAAMHFAQPVDVVLLANRPSCEAELDCVIEESRMANAAVLVAADPEMTDTASVEYLDLDGHLIYGLHEIRRRQTHEFGSRLLDICLSCLLLMAVSPLLALTCLLVKLDSSGPIFFRQIRIGKDGRPFTIIKFRTMFLHCCGSGVSPVDSHDPRITRTGRWLRKTSIDELPQLLNVLMGQMALVGPRPEMPFIVDRYTPEQRQRLSVRPGLTGLWQLSADRCRPIHENLHYDFYYLRRRSIFVDAAILCHTVLYAMHGT